MFFHLIFSPPSICLVMIARISAFHKGQLIEVAYTGSPSDAVSSVVHRVVKHVRTCGAEERDYTRQERKNTRTKKALLFYQCLHLLSV